MDERKEIKKFAPSNKEPWEDLVRKKLSDIKYECPTSFYQESMLFIKRRIQFKRLRLICSSAAVLFVILGISFWIERQNQEMVRKKASQESIEQCFCTKQGRKEKRYCAGSGLSGCSFVRENRKRKNDKDKRLCIFYAIRE